MRLARLRSVRQRPLRKGWNLDRLPVLVQGHPHLSEVVEVTPEAEAGCGPLEGLCFRCRHRIILVGPLLSAAGVAAEPLNGERAGHQNLAGLNLLVLLHPGDG